MLRMRKHLVQMNEFDWSCFHHDTLNTLHKRETEGLRTMLLNGASWEEVREQVRRVTELSIALHKKHSGGLSHPAEFGRLPENNTP